MFTMFRYIQRPNIFQKYLFSSFKRLPTSVSHIKLCCLRIIKANNYSTDIAKQRSSISQTQKEILVYEFNNSKFFLKISILSLLNYSIWFLLGISSYQLVSEIPANSENPSLLADESNQKLLKNVVIAALILGALLVISVWIYILRSIRKIILQRETNNVIFETFTPVNTVRRFTVPVQHVSGVMSRHKVKGYIPLKIKGKIFYFLLDVNGTLRNPSLFDSYIALKRDLNK